MEFSQTMILFFVVGCVVVGFAVGYLWGWNACTAEAERRWAEAVGRAASPSKASKT